MIFRAFGSDRISRLGYAKSNDGINWEVRPEPAVIPMPNDPQEKFGLEDPRIVKVGTQYYITYTAATGRSVNGSWVWQTRVRFLKTPDFKQFERVIPQLPDQDDKNSLIFPKKIQGYYWLAHRIMPDVWISRSKDLIHFSDHKMILSPQGRGWQAQKIGGGSQPIETPLGWLIFYHGVNPLNVYSMGAIILDVNDPYKVLYQLPYPLLRPVRNYEKQGIVREVVFGTSVIDRGEDYWLYYGAADTVIALASINKEGLLSELVRYPVSPAKK